MTNFTNALTDGSRAYNVWFSLKISTTHVARTRSTVISTKLKRCLSSLMKRLASTLSKQTLDCLEYSALIFWQKRLIHICLCGKIKKQIVGPFQQTANSSEANVYQQISKQFWIRLTLTPRSPFCKFETLIAKT